MDLKKSRLNVGVAIVFKLATVFLSVAVKATLIKVCGNEVNGLNALFISIIGFLSVAELGVGSAITFCMYKPIVAGETDKIGALYQLFKKVYQLVGVVILVAGIALLPFLQLFAKDYSEINQNIYVTFLLVLVSVTLTYFFSAKTSLINAYKNNYITTAITQGGLVLQYVLQIVTLIITGSFIGYLICRIVAVAAQWCITEIIADRKYRNIIINKSKLDPDTMTTVKKSVSAMFMHKVGTVLVNTVDGVIISAFVGVVALGEYSNYNTILVAMTSVISLLFSSLTSVIGHLCVEEDIKTARRYCDSFHLLNYVIATIFFAGYYAVIDSLIALLFSPDLLVDKSVSFVITLNGFVQFMRRSTLTFRDATGTFYSDRWKPLIEGIVNVIGSILLVKAIGVTGVIVATIITNLVICHVIEPYVLYKNAFSVFPKAYYLKNYGMILVFVVALIVLNAFLQSFPNELVTLVVNGCVAVGVAALACAVIVLFDVKTAKNTVMILKKGK